MHIRALFTRAIFLTAFLTLAIAAPVLAQVNPPEANAGIDRTVAVGDVVVLDGTRSVGTGAIPGAGNMFLMSWSLVSAPAGSTAALTGPTQMKPTFRVDLPGDYVVQLVVTEGAAVSAPDTVVISTANSTPVANPGADRKILAGEVVQLDGAGSWDVDGDRLSYAWTLVSAPAGSGAIISDPLAAQPTFASDLAGTYVAQLVVSDGVRTSDPKTVTFSTGNMAPVADAGDDQTVQSLTSIIPDGYRSSDPDGDTLAYNWTVLWGPDTAFVSIDTVTTRRSAFAQWGGGIYVLQLVAKDGLLSSRPDTLVLMADGVGNLPPVAVAGPDQAVAAGATARLDATNSHDINGGSLKFRWALISAPPGSVAAISDPTSARPSFTADLAGTYVAQLIASDGIEDSLPDTVVISTENLAPVANAGPDQLNTGSTPTIQLNGSASIDANGDALTYRWSLIERPAGSTAVLSDPTAVNPTFVADMADVYIAQLYVSDGISESRADRVLISTQPLRTAYSNGRPVADAGVDRTGVALGATVSLSGSASRDLEGTALSYRWALTVKPTGSAATIAGATGVNPSFVADVTGLYVAQLIVKDVYLYSEPPDMVVIETVNPAPVANAGPDQSVLAGQTVQLDGSASSGSPLSYNWALTAKPAGSKAAIIGPTTATPTFVADLDGLYTARLTVNDGTLFSTDSVAVTATNQPPVLAPIGPQAVDLGSTLRLTLTASDANPGTTLAFSAQPLPLPAGASLNGTAGEFVFTPSLEQVGIVALTFSVSDGLLADSESVSITVNGPPVGGVTAISGRILDTNDFVATGTITSVQGATVSVLNAPTVTAVSDASGYFTLSGIPAGAQVFDIDATTVVNAPVGVSYAGFREELTLIADVTNNIARPLYLPRIEAESLTQVVTGVATTVTNTRLGVSMFVAADTARNPDGSLFLGELSISEVPAGLAPASLPDLLKPGLLVTIQPVGVTFSTPAPITFPNIDNLAIGKRANLWSLDAASGAFAITGVSQVSTDGTQLVRFSGGIRAADWHAVLPPSPVDISQEDPEKEEECGCDAPSGSATSLHSGNLKETHNLVGYNSAGQSHSLEFVYNSTAADPSPVITTDIRIAANIFNAMPETVSTRVLLSGVEQKVEQYVGTAGLNPAVTESIRFAARVDANDLETGIYPFQKTLMSNFAASSAGIANSGAVRVNNERNSPFGSGWTLSGLNRFRVAGGILTDGRGGISRFKTAVDDIFREPVEYGSLGNPFAGQKLDYFNGDGFLDIAVADTVTDRVHILLGDGAGGFSAGIVTDPAPNVLDTEVEAYSVESGYFNADTIRDIATVLGTDGRGQSGKLNDLIAIQFGNGDGTFGAPVHLDIDLNSHLIEVADFDRDGNDDIAYGAYFSNVGGVISGGVHVFFGDGLGNFPVERRIELPPVNGVEPFSGGLVAANLNADLYPDIVTRRGDGILVYLNDGLGGFPAGVRYPVIWTDTALGWGAQSVLTADFNDDNKPDIATSSGIAVELFLGNGLGGFGPATEYPTSNFAWTESLAITDFNGDLVPDVVVGGCCSPYAAVQLGDGAGGLGPSTPFAMSPNINNSVRIGTVRATDLDGDGRGDIIASVWGDRPGRISVLLGLPEGTTKYVSPPSDYSKLVKNVDGTFTRTMRNGTKYQFDANGYQTAVTDLIGRTTGYAYDLSNRIKTVTDAAGLVTTFNYVGDRLDNVVDPANRVTMFQHDLAGNLIKITDPDNSFRQFGYDPEHRLVSQTDKRGFSKTYEYDTFGRHARSVWPDGTERLMTAVQTKGLIDTATGFGTAANPAPPVRLTDADGTFRDGNNNQEIRKTNRFGFITSRTVAAGTPEERTIATTRDTNNLVTRIVEPERTTTMTYFPNGLVRTRTVRDTTTHTLPYSTAGQSRFWIYTYNALNKVETVDGPRTDVADITRYDYDPVTGNLLKTTNALDHVTEITGYNAFGQPLGTRDANGVETTLVYYPEGWLQTSTVDSGIGGTPATTGFTYDGAGNMKTTTLPDGSTLTYEYDGMGRVKAIENGAGERMVYTYDAAGNREKTEVFAAPTAVDVPGEIVRTSSAVYDNLNRLLKSLGAYVGEETLYDYDGNGNVFKVTDPLANATETVFDPLNRVIKVIEPPVDGVSGFTTYTYDAAGNQETAIDQRGLTTSYVHNGFGEVIQRTSPDTGVTVYRYDSAGNQIQRTDARAVETNWTYDALGRVLTMEFPGNIAENVTYAYDDPTVGNYGIGRIASVTDDSGSMSYVYDARGNVVRETRVIETPGLAVQTYVTEYSHDLADRLAAMTYPSGRIVEYGRDTLGRVITVTMRETELAAPVTLASAGTYEPFGGLDGLTYGNNVTLALAHDLDGRLERMDVFNSSGTAILDLDYGFDLAGNIKTVADVGGVTRGRDYTYDNLYRLTQAKEFASDGTVSLQSDYGYDAVGNRTSRVAGATSETYDYDTISNRLTSVTAGTATRLLGYNASGNTESDDKGDGGPALTFGYDQTDRLISVTQGTAALGEYLHNAMGQRVSKTVSGVTTHYLYSGGNIIGEVDGATGVVQEEYVWFSRVPLAFISSGTVYTVHADHLGTPQRLTDATGSVAWDASYRPFGKVTLTSSITFNLRFPGQYLDQETGLHDNWFRSYDSALGRYIQSDPTGLSSGWNTYAYVGSNPVAGIDPEGLRRRCYPDQCTYDCLTEIFGNISSTKVYDKAKDIAFIGNMYATTRKNLILISEQYAGVYAGSDCSGFWTHNRYKTVLHEYWHVVGQWNPGRMGKISYLWEGVKNGHTNNKWEIEATAWARLFVGDYKRCLDKCEECE